MNHGNIDYEYYESVSRNQLRQQKKFDPLVEFPRDPFYETHRSLSEMLDRYETHARNIIRKFDESNLPKKKSWAFKFFYCGRH
jgi:hypothetical protein